MRPFRIRPADVPAVTSMCPLTLCVYRGRSPSWPVTRPRPRWGTQRLPRQWLQPSEPSGRFAGGSPAPAGASHPSHRGPLHKVPRVPEHPQARGLAVTGPAWRKPGHHREDGHPRRAWGRAPGPVIGDRDVLANPQTPAMVPAPPPAAEDLGVRRRAPRVPSAPASRQAAESQSRFASPDLQRPASPAFFLSSVLSHQSLERSSYSL